MTPSALEAAELLWRHRCAGTTLCSLPAPLKPGSSAEGHAIQAAWPTVSGQRVVGWKLAATSAAGQAHINVKAPLPGRILASFVHAIGDKVSLTGNRMRVVEPEFAFRMDSDLPPRATPRSQSEVLAAVASLHPAFEVPDSRYTDFTCAGEEQLLADDACCGSFVFGAAAPDTWRGMDLGSARVHALVRDAAGAVRIRRDGLVELIQPEFETARSQDLEEAYHDAGQFYWGTAHAWREGLPIMSGPNSGAYVLPRARVQDIDTPEDWDRAEAMFRALSASTKR